MNVISVENTSHEYHTLKHTREFTLERNLSFSTSVENTHLNGKLYHCDQYRKSFSTKRPGLGRVDQAESENTCLP